MQPLFTLRARRPLLAQGRAAPSPEPCFRFGASGASGHPLVGLSFDPRLQFFIPTSSTAREAQGAVMISRKNQTVRSWLCERRAGGKSLPLCATGRGQGWGSGLISAGTALPTGFPFSKPGSEGPGGKPGGKHWPSSMLHLLPSSLRPLMLPVRRPATGPGPL